MAALIFLKGTQVYWLNQMMNRGLIRDQGCTNELKNTCPL